MSYQRNKCDIDYKMGVSIGEVGPGDVVKVEPGELGELEVITSIEPSGKWDKTITTASGRRLGMMPVYAYGKREEK